MYPKLLFREIFSRNYQQQQLLLVVDRVQKLFDNLKCFSVTLSLLQHSCLDLFLTASGLVIRTKTCQALELTSFSPTSVLPPTFCFALIWLVATVIDFDPP